MVFQIYWWTVSPELEKGVRWEVVLKGTNVAS